MNYPSEISKKQQAKDFNSMIELYRASNTWEEFKISFDFEFPNASKMTMIAFWLYWKRKTSCLYYMIHAVSYVLGFTCLFLGVVIHPIFIVISFLYLITEVWYTSTFYDTMSKIEWYEHGCPVDF